MAAKEPIRNNGINGLGDVEWPGIVSRFQLVILAGRRSKQLLRGATPRIAVDRLKRRNTSIALEELRQGLIPLRPLGVLTTQEAVETVVV